jgi:hypothetical protein
VSARDKGYEDRDLHLLRDVFVAEEPDVAAELARAMVVESQQQLARNEERWKAIGFFFARTQLTVKLRVFGAVPLVRKMRAEEAMVVWGAVARAALARAGGG